MTRDETIATVLLVLLLATVVADVTRTVLACVRIRREQREYVARCRDERGEEER